MRVYEVVDLATSDAPPLRTDVETIVAAGRRRRRNRLVSIGTGIAVVAAVLTVTAIAVPIGRSFSTAPRLAAPAASPPASPAARPNAAPKVFPVPNGPWTFTIKPYDAGAYHVATLTAV